MIPRYSRARMEQIWSPVHRYQKWLDIEILACEAMTKLGLIPSSSLRIIKKRAGFDVERIDEIEQTTKHDVIAFLTSVTERVGSEGRFIHMGLTSSDILDTSLACLLKEAADILLADLDELLEVLKRRALEHKHTLMIGRSHGIHAEPITFGLKLALWYKEMERNRQQLISGPGETISTGKIARCGGHFSLLSTPL